MLKIRIGFNADRIQLFTLSRTNADPDPSPIFRHKKVNFYMKNIIAVDPDTIRIGSIFNGIFFSGIRIQEAGCSL